MARIRGQQTFAVPYRFLRESVAIFLFPKPLRCGFPRQRIVLRDDGKFSGNGRFPRSRGCILSPLRNTQPRETSE